MANWFAGGGSEIAGGTIYTGLYAASPVYCGGPGVVTKDVVVASCAADDEEPEPPTGARVVCPVRP